MSAALVFNINKQQASMRKRQPEQASCFTLKHVVSAFIADCSAIGL